MTPEKSPGICSRNTPTLNDPPLKHSVTIARNEFRAILGIYRRIFLTSKTTGPICLSSIDGDDK